MTEQDRELAAAMAEALETNLPWPELHVTEVNAENGDMHGQVFVLSPALAMALAQKLREIATDV